MKKTLAVATFAALVGVAGAANAADLYKGGSMKDAPVYVCTPSDLDRLLHRRAMSAALGVSRRTVIMTIGTCTPIAGKIPTTAYSAAARLATTTRPAHSCSASKLISVQLDFSNNNQYLDYYWTKQDASFYADVTGRLGYAAGPALFYVKGGWAYLITPVPLALASALTTGGAPITNRSTAGHSAAASNICGARPGA